MTKEEMMLAEEREKERLDWERATSQEERDLLNEMRGRRGLPIDPHGFNRGRYDEKGRVMV